MTVLRRGIVQEETVASGLGVAEHAEDWERRYHGNGVVAELGLRMASTVVRDNWRTTAGWWAEHWRHRLRLGATRWLLDLVVMYDCRLGLDVMVEWGIADTQSKDWSEKWARGGVDRDGGVASLNSDLTGKEDWEKIPQSKKNSSHFEKEKKKIVKGTRLIEYVKIQ